jgi:3-oxoacyl-(acyl-carrier-protein) synthase
MLQKGVDVLITGIGVIVPGAVGAEAFARRIAETREPRWFVDSGPIAESEFIHLLNARRVRRMSEYVKLTLAATALALQDSKIDPAGGFAEECSVILGSMHGSADFSSNYYREIVRHGYIGANPVLFAEGVPNAAAAHLSLMLGLKGACQTVIGSRTSGLDALHLAATRIRTGQWDRAIVGAGEEYSPLVSGAYAHCGLHAGERGAAPAEEKGFVTGSAAVTFVLESRAAAERRGATSRGQVLRCSAGRGRPNEMVESAGRVLRELGDVPAVMTSSCGTWIDRGEAAAVRRALPALPNAAVSSIYGHVAEHFSASALLSVAAVLLGGGRLPRDLGARAATADAPPRVDRFAALCTDFTGCVSAGLFTTPL